MSLTASKTLASTLVYSQWKGRFYVRLRVIPYNPKSDYQTGIRETLTWGVLYFTKGDYVADAQKTWWNTYADAESPPVSGFNRFMRKFIEDCYDEGTGTFIFLAIPDPE